MEGKLAFFLASYSKRNSPPFVARAERGFYHAIIELVIAKTHFKIHIVQERQQVRK
jgi:hypothetical protein